MLMERFLSAWYHRYRANRIVNYKSWDLCHIQTSSTSKLFSIPMEKRFERSPFPHLGADFSFTFRRMKFTSILFLNTFQTPFTAPAVITQSWSSLCRCFKSSCTCISFSGHLPTYTQWASAIAILNLRISCWTLPRAFWICAISAQQKSSSLESQMLVTFARGTTEHLNLFSVLPTTQQTLVGNNIIP